MVEQHVYDRNCDIPFDVRSTRFPLCSANTLGLKATTESKKYYIIIKKSCDADKYRRMTG